MQRMPRFRLRAGGATRILGSIDAILHARYSFSKETAMDPRIDEPVVALQAGEVITLDDAEGFRIHARAGTLWVTEEDDYEDHIVAAGDARVISHPGRTVVQALAPARISIREVAANDPTQTAA
jgi:hypothetical protein